MRYIKKFESMEDEYTIDTKINNSRGRLREILVDIKKNISNEYIVYTEDYCKDVIDDIKKLGFEVKIYDDSNEYSEDFDNKVKISWKK